MGQLAAIAFFSVILAGVAALLVVTIKDHLTEIAAALGGETPARNNARPWMRSVKVSARPRPAAARAIVRKHAAV